MAIQSGDQLPFSQVLQIVFPYGLSLTFAGIGFGTIASFITLYYASRHWPDAGRDLSLFGASFVAVRLLLRERHIPNSDVVQAGLRRARDSLSGQESHCLCGLEREGRPPGSGDFNV